MLEKENEKLNDILEIINQKMKAVQQDRMSLGTTLNEDYLSAAKAEKRAIEMRTGIAVLRASNVSDASKNILQIAEESIERVQDTGLGVESINALQEQMSTLIDLTKLNNDIGVEEKELLVKRFSEINETLQSKQFSRTGMALNRGSRGLMNLAKSFIDPVNIVAKLTGGNMMATGLTRYILDRRRESKKADMEQKKLRAKFRIESAERFIEAAQGIDFESVKKTPRSKLTGANIEVAGQEFEANMTYENVRKGVTDALNEVQQNSQPVSSVRENVKSVADLISALNTDELSDNTKQLLAMLQSGENISPGDTEAISQLLRESTQQESVQNSVQQMILDSIQEELNASAGTNIIPQKLMGDITQGVLETSFNDPQFIAGFQEGLMEELKAAGFAEMNLSLGQLLELAQNKIEPEIKETNELLSSFIRAQEFAADRSGEEKREFAELIKDTIGGTTNAIVPEKKSSGGGIASIIRMIPGLGKVLGGATGAVVGGAAGAGGIAILAKVIGGIKDIPKTILNFGKMITSSLGNIVKSIGTIVGTVIKSIGKGILRFIPMLAKVLNPVTLIAGVAGAIGYKLGSMIYDSFAAQILDGIEWVVNGIKKVSGWITNLPFFKGDVDAEPQTTYEAPRREDVESRLQQAAENQSQTKQTGRGAQKAQEQPSVAPAQKPTPAPRGRGATKKVAPAPIPNPPVSNIAPSSSVSPSSSSDATIGDVIAEAASKVGVDKGFMFAMAKQESSFNPNAKASTSSASGLFQFIDDTWSSMVAKYGSKFPELNLGRFSPIASATAGALYAKDNSKILREAGIPVNGSTLYASHFLGPGGAKKLYNAPADMAAADVLPSAAASNFNVFYNKDGTPKTVADVQQFMFQKIGKKSEEYNQKLQSMSPSQLVASITGSSAPLSATFPTTAPLLEGGTIAPAPKPAMSSPEAANAPSTSTASPVISAGAMSAFMGSIDDSNMIENQYSSTIAPAMQSIGESSTQRFDENGNVLPAVDMKRDGPEFIGNAVGMVEGVANTINNTVDKIVNPPLQQVLGQGKDFAKRIGSTAERRFGLESSPQKGNSSGGNFVDARKTTVVNGGKSSGGSSAPVIMGSMEPTLKRLSNMNLFHVYVN